MSLASPDRKSLVGARVCKIGGGLLAEPDFPDRFRGWRSFQSAVPHLLIAGGGGFADEIRRLDRAGVLGDAEAHWLAIGAMGLSARVLAAVLGGLPVHSRLGEAAKAAARGAADLVVDLEEDLRDLAADVLPVGWHVTSDSIAAAVASSLEAELVLLKSVGGEAPMTVADAARLGWVDAHFPAAAQGLAVRWVNLQSGRETGLAPAR